MHFLLNENLFFRADLPRRFHAFSPQILEDSLRKTSIGIAPESSKIWGDADLDAGFRADFPSSLVERVRFARRPCVETDLRDIRAHLSVVPYWASSARVSAAGRSDDTRSSSDNSTLGGQLWDKGGELWERTRTVEKPTGEQQSENQTASSSEGLTKGGKDLAGQLLGSVFAGVGVGLAKLADHAGLGTFGGPAAEQHLMSCSVSLLNFDHFESTQSFLRGADCGHKWLGDEVRSALAYEIPFAWFLAANNR